MLLGKKSYIVRKPVYFPLKGTIFVGSPKVEYLGMKYLSNQC